MSSSGAATALVNYAGSIGADVPIPVGSWTTFETTPSLAPGTYLVIVSGIELFGATNTVADVRAVVGTATATLAGKQTDSIQYTDGGSSVTMVFVATVTVAGTLVFQGNTISGSAATVKAASLGSATAHATGYSIIKIG